VNLWGFPNPVDWAIDKVTGFIGGAAATGFEAMIGGLVAWVVDAVVWIVGGVFNFFLDAADPNVQAGWFVGPNGPFTATLGIGIGVLVLCCLAGIIQGVLHGEPGAMIRRIGLDLPITVLGMTAIITMTQLLIRLTDLLSMGLVDRFQADITTFGTVVASLQQLSGGPATALVVFLLGLATVLAGLVLVAELLIRSSLIYIVVALSPLVLATRLWPATRPASRRLLELLFALIVSKLVIATALAIAAAAAVGSGTGGAVTALPAPEVYAEDPGGSVTQAVGILLTAGVTFAVAAYSPLLLAKLVPFTEAALVAHGIRSAPVRATQHALMAANTVSLATGHNLARLAAGPTLTAAAPSRGPTTSPGPASPAVAALPEARRATPPKQDGSA
jgi:hypothetical protein